jgi:lipopolysaccharide biosynthesis protein
MVIRTIKGAEQIKDKVCVFSHFDQRGHIWPHTRDYIDALIAEGFAVVFVSNSASLNRDSEAFATSRSAAIILRRNKGYDFGAYRDGLLHLGDDVHGLKCLIFANDSVYGPFIPLRSMLNRMDFSMMDVWMATDSWQTRYHGQSYFMAFGPTALKHLAFMSFWSSVPNLIFKRSIIRYCEVGLTQHFLSAGLRVGAVWRYLDLVDRISSRDLKNDSLHLADASMIALIQSAQKKRVGLNSTHHLWLELLRNEFPFIKRELLRDNPAKVEGLSAWHQIVGKTNLAAYDAIILHLAQTIRNKAP